MGCYQQKGGSASILIDLWYGNNQIFGTPGLAQRTINILGNVESKNGIDSTSYRLNKDEWMPFSLGTDLHRLAAEGDFNIDIHANRLQTGKNELIILVKDSLGNQSKQTVNITFNSNNTCPLPYSIQWNNVENLQTSIQVTDGKWEFTTEGIRNRDVYYDRMFAIGDSTWKNYEVLTSVIFHQMIPLSPGPPNYNVSHAGIASRWFGHGKDTLQPNRQWWPVGAFAYLRITDDYDSCQWKMQDGQGLNAAQPMDESRVIQKEVKYMMKHRVEDISETETKFSSKLWRATQKEPKEWDLIAVKPTNQQSGSALLVAHFTEVTFGDIHVIPLSR
jgi:hypothetical protein